MYDFAEPKSYQPVYVRSYNTWYVTLVDDIDTYLTNDGRIRSVHDIMSNNETFAQCYFPTKEDAEQAVLDFLFKQSTYIIADNMKGSVPVPIKSHPLFEEDEQ